MPLDPTATYHTEPLADGIRIVLPRRPGGHGGICVILFGMMFSGFAVFWMLGASGLLDPLLDSMTESLDVPTATPPDDFEEGFEEKAPQGPEPEAAPTPTPERNDAPKRLEFPKRPADDSGGFDSGRLFFGLFGVPFFLAGLVPIFAGIMSIFGHGEVEITADQICAIDRAGPIRRRKCRSARELTHFQIGRLSQPAPAENARRRPEPKAIFTVYAIHAHFSAADTLTIASGYPLVTLRELAKELASEHERISKRDRVAINEDHHDQAAATFTNEPFIPETVPPQPADSTIEVTRVASGVTLRIPPAGLRKASKAPFFFGLFWCGFVALFTLAMAASGVPWPFYLFISLFWFIGLAILLTGINMARRQAVLDVVHDTLLVTRQSLFGRSQHEWRVEDLLDIRVDHSGMSVNDKAIMNLQVVPREGRVLGLCTGRDEAELYWMAAELRSALGMRKSD